MTAYLRVNLNLALIAMVLLLCGPLISHLGGPMWLRLGLAAVALVLIVLSLVRSALYYRRQKEGLRPGQ